MPDNASFSSLYTSPSYTRGTSTSPATETVTNNSVSPEINAQIDSQPYNFLIGANNYDNGAAIDAGAAATEPVLDGEPDYSGATGVPTDLGSYATTPPGNLNPTVFESWTSEQESEYLNYWISVYQQQYGTGAAGLAAFNAANGTNYTSWVQAPSIIGSNVAGATPITAVLSQSLPATVYIVQTLQATDIASMSQVDLQAVAGTPAFQAVATELGLATDTQSSLNDIQDEINLILGTDTISSTETTQYTTTYVADAGPGVPPSVGAVTDSQGDKTVTTEANGVVTSTETGNNGQNFTETTTYTAQGNNQYSVTSSYKGVGQISGQSPGASTSIPPDGVTATTNPDGTTTTTTVVTNADGSVTATAQTTSGASTDTTVTTYSNVVNIPSANGVIAVANMPLADREVFVQELQMLEQQVQSDPVVNSDQIEQDINAIGQRFSLAAAYWTQVTPTTSSLGTSGLTTGVVSGDGNASIAAAYNTFMTQEKQILSTMQAEQSVGATGTIDGVEVDAPTLGMYYEMLGYQSEQASINNDTAELQQINELLQYYSDMQNLVSQTEADIPASAGPTDQYALLNSPGSVSSLSSIDLTMVNMFSSITGTTPSPLEALLGITRPTANLVSSTGSLNGLTQQQWSDFGDALASSVAQLQQQAQILMDKVNQEVQTQDDDFNEAVNIETNLSTLLDEMGNNLN